MNNKDFNKINGNVQEMWKIIKSSTNNKAQEENILISILGNRNLLLTNMSNIVTTSWMQSTVCAFKLDVISLTAHS